MKTGPISQESHLVPNKMKSNFHELRMWRSCSSCAQVLTPTAYCSKFSEVKNLYVWLYLLELDSLGRKLTTGSLLTSGPRGKCHTARARSNEAAGLNASVLTDNYYPHTMLIISESPWMYSAATKVSKEKDSGPQK